MKWMNVLSGIGLARGGLPVVLGLVLMLGVTDRIEAQAKDGGTGAPATEPTPSRVGDEDTQGFFDEACCFPDGSCAVVNLGACSSQGGVGQGLFTVCTPNPCPQPPMGACCFEFENGDCSFTTFDTCDQFSGTWFGAGSSCSPNPCPQPGACCYPDGSCEIDALLQGITCTNNGGVYQGDDTVCSPNPCVGGCCLSGGPQVCTDTTEENCVVNLGGVFFGLGTTCSSAEVDCLGACCLLGGGCFEQVELLCLTEDLGTFGGVGSTCAETACTQPGACCLPDGSCVQATILGGGTCANMGGLYQGDGTVCGPMVVCPQPECPGTGSCNLAHATRGCDNEDCCNLVCNIDPFCCNVQWDQACVDQAAMVCRTPGTCNPNAGPCNDLNGTPGCDDEVCCAAVCRFESFCCDNEWDAFCVAVAAFACGLPSGACCVDGSCQLLTVDACTTLGGVYWGVGSPCILCNGGCCDSVFLNGACTEGTGANCEVWGGVFQGIGTTCTDCFGACCLADGSCVELIAAECLDMTGDAQAFQGLGTTCATANCPVPLPDDCDARMMVTAGATTFDLTDATTDGAQEPDCMFPFGGPDNLGVNQDLWYNYTASVNGTAYIDTCGMANVDTRLVVYEGCSCPTGLPLECNDDHGDATESDSGVACPEALESSLSIPVTAGQCYKIRVGAFVTNGSAGGADVLTIQEFESLPGACCLDSGCMPLVESLCTAAGGTFQGVGTPCSSCPLFPACPGEGDCFVPNGTPGCADSACCELICGLDAFCCDSEWDQLCADQAAANCASPPCPWDCVPDNGDGTFGNGVVNIDDLLAVINGFGGAGGPCDNTPDNGDGTFGNGVINIDDLLGVINNFGGCP